MHISRLPYLPYLPYLCGHLLSTLLFQLWLAARFQEGGELGAGQVGHPVLSAAW